VLADHREQVAEQRAVVGGEALGDLVDRSGRAVRGLGPDLNVATAIRRSGSSAVGR
jgi:hypothetical protein